jgi:DNA adenine methylase
MYFLSSHYWNFSLLEFLYVFWESRDTPEAFFYLDPPYVGYDQGHYDGYTQEDFDALLQLLETIRGKFLLSSFRNASLTDFTRRNGWFTEEIRLSSSMTHGQGRTVRDKVLHKI